jgi:hypothetical protein
MVSGVPVCYRSEGLMPQPLVVQQSLVIPVGVEKAFNGTLPAPIPVVFSNWHGPLPPVKRVEGQEGEWRAVGQTRVLKLADGSSMREEMTDVDSPRSFGYRITEMTGALALLIAKVEGAFLFEPVDVATDSATDVTWRWTVQPRSRLSALAMPVFAALWKGYARKALRALSEMLTG